MPRGVAKDGVEKKGKGVGKRDDGKKGVVKRNRKMRGGDEIFYHKIQGFITKNTPIFKEKKEAIIKVLNDSMIGYNNSIGRSLTPSRLDFNKSSRFKNTLKATISYLNAIGNISTIEPTLVKFPLYPVANELADVLLDILDNKDIMKDIEQRNDLILQFIYIKIFILFTEFNYFCDRINYIKEYNIVEAPQVEGVAELATLTAAKEAVDAELAAANAEKDAAVAKLATANAEKNKAIAALAAANAQKDKINEELVAEKEARKQVETEFAEAKRKHQESYDNFKLSTDNILTIDEDYFMNAYANAKIKYGKGEDVKAIKILDNIIAIWKLLKDDTELKKNNEISKIINDEIPKLKRSYKEAPDWLNKGGKRKINSSRTKRK